MRQGAVLEGGRRLTPELYRRLRDEELAKLEGGRLGEAAELLDGLVLAPEYVPFLTLIAYDKLG